jgi:hypothetical protein
MWLPEDLEDTPFKWKNEYKIFGLLDFFYLRSMQLSLIAFKNYEYIISFAVLQ